MQHLGILIRKITILPWFFLPTIKRLESTNQSKKGYTTTGKKTNFLIKHDLLITKRRELEHTMSLKTIKAMTKKRKNRISNSASFTKLKTAFTARVSGDSFLVSNRLLIADCFRAQSIVSSLHICNTKRQREKRQWLLVFLRLGFDPNILATQLEISGHSPIWF